MTTVKRLLAERAKLVTYAGGVAVGVVALGVLHGAALAITEAAAVVLTGGAIHQVPNKPKD